MKFDLIISNPPYNNGLDLKILNSIDGLGEKICFIHPAGWLLSKNEKIRPTVGDELKEKLKNKFSDYVVVDNASSLFNIAGSPNDISITIFEDKPKLIIDIFDIDQHGNSIIYKAIKEKILLLANNVSMKDMLNGRKKKFQVGVASILGHTSSKDFHTFTQLRNPTMHFTDNYGNNFYFDTKVEANNFFNWLNLKVVRFCLSIYKINKNIIFSSVPYMSTYAHEWTDEMVAEEIGLTHEEMIWMINWIPDYYPGDEEKYEKYFDSNQQDRQLLGTKYTYGGYKI